MPNPPQGIVIINGKPSKRCAHCTKKKGRLVYHGIDKFYKSKKYSSGLASSCIKAQKVKAREYERRHRIRKQAAVMDEMRESAGNEDVCYPKRSKYTSLLTDDALFAQKFLTRGLRIKI